MRTNEKLALGLVGGLALGLVAQRMVSVSGKGLGMSPVQLAAVGLTVSTLMAPMVAKVGR